MSSLITLQNISAQSPHKVLFEDLTFSINPGQKLGLVGQNGSGKSTLLEILLGRRSPDTGTRIVRRGLQVRLVEQFPSDKILKQSLWQSVLESLPTTWNDELWRVEEALRDQGFADSEFEKWGRELSGGWMNRLLLARALVANPDVILLDEPTNHLDTEGIAFFEETLRCRPDLTYVLVSHDRTLLQRTTDSTLFLKHGRLWSFALPFFEARSALAEAEAAAARKRADEEKEIARLEAAAKRLAQWGRTFELESASRQAKSILRRTEKMKDNLTFVGKEKNGKIQMQSKEIASKFVLQIENFTVHTPLGRPLFHIDRMAIRPGDKVALVAPNGAGKTCLLDSVARLLHAELPEIRKNPQVEAGYYSQNLGGVSDDITPMKLLRQVAPHENPEDCKHALIRAGFPVARHNQGCRGMSGGERARLLILALSLKKPGLWILDEPTNHIDVDGCEALERELESPDATALMVSHDRHFVRAVANRVFTVEKGKLVELHS